MKKLQIINIPPRNVEEALGALTGIAGALIGKREMCLDVASQCKASGIIEIFVQVLVTSRQKYLLADRSTLGANIGRLGNFGLNDVGWRPQPPSSMRYTE